MRGEGGGHADGHGGDVWRRLELAREGRRASLEVQDFQACCHLATHHDRLVFLFVVVLLFLLFLLLVFLVLLPSFTVCVLV